MPGIFEQPPSETFVLGQRIEGDMARISHDTTEFSGQVGDGIGMRFRFHFLETKPGFVQRGSGSALHVFADDGESAPHGKTLECQYDLHARLALHAGYEFEVFAQARFFEDETGGRNLF